MTALSKSVHILTAAQGLLLLQHLGGPLLHGRQPITIIKHLLATLLADFVVSISVTDKMYVRTGKVADKREEAKGCKYH